MKTIVFTFKNGFENQTDYGYDRIELIPGLPDFAYFDGELEEFDKEIIGETLTSDEEDYPYLTTYEESKWIN